MSHLRPFACEFLYLAHSLFEVAVWTCALVCFVLDDEISALLGDRRPPPFVYNHERSTRVDGEEEGICRFVIRQQ